MTKAIPAPLTAQETEGYSFANVLEVCQATTFSEEILSLWKGWMEANLFSSKAEVQRKLTGYPDYLKSEKCAAEVKNMVSSIAFELVKFPEKYDAAGVMIALAQNGGTCHVQMEIGIRTVYAAMMDSLMEHMKANAVETKILSLLRKNRLGLSEKVAYTLCKEKGWHNGKVLNSHYIVPLQNKLASRIGIDSIPDPNAFISEPQDLYEDFMKAYNVEYLLRIVGGAVNDSHRLINYHDFVEHIERLRPAEVDSFAFLNDFVFNVETGKFTDKALKFVLLKMDIICLTPEGQAFVDECKKNAVNVEAPTQTLDKVESVENTAITVQ